MDIITQRSNPFKDAKNWMSKANLTAESYAIAAEKGYTLTEWIEDLKKSEGVSTVYAGLTPLQIAKKRASIKAAGQEPPMLGLYEMFDHAGLNVMGARAHTADKFFEFAGLDVLFPEYINNRILTGALIASAIPIITMGEVVIDALDYYKIYLDDVESTRQMSIGSELADIPERQIKVSKEGIRLKRYNAYLTISYEALRFHRLNVYGAALELYGMQLGIDETDDAIYVALNGDGNSNTPYTNLSVEDDDTINTSDAIGWSMALPSPFRMDVFLARKAYIKKYLTQLSNFQNPRDQFGFMSIGLPKWIEWERDVLTSDIFLGFDSRYALQQVTCGGVQSKSEDIVRRLGTGTALWKYSGVSVFTNKAIATLNINLP